MFPLPLSFDYFDDPCTVGVVKKMARRIFVCQLGSWFFFFFVSCFEGRLIHHHFFLRKLKKNLIQVFECSASTFLVNWYSICPVRALPIRPSQKVSKRRLTAVPVSVEGTSVSLCVHSPSIHLCTRSVFSVAWLQMPFHIALSPSVLYPLSRRFIPSQLPSPDLPCARSLGCIRTCCAFKGRTQESSAVTIDTIAVRTCGYTLYPPIAYGRCQITTKERGDFLVNVWLHFIAHLNTPSYIISLNLQNSIRMIKIRWPSSNEKYCVNSSHIMWNKMTFRLKL